MNISPVKLWRHQKKVSQILGKLGKIISWTLVRVPPIGYEQEAPYPVILVEFNNKNRLMGQLVDWKKENLKTGQKVIACYRRIRKPDLEGVIPYGIKFKPIEAF